MVSQFYCEICGRIIEGPSHKVIIEGVKFIVCNECSKLKSTQTLSDKKSVPKILPKTVHRNVSKSRSSLIIDYELVNGYGKIIRKTREKLGLTHEKVGEKINEKASVIKKVENEELFPTKGLALKLERFLGIRLLKPIDQLLPKDIENIAPTSKYDRTLGDIVVIKKRKKQA